MYNKFITKKITETYEIDYKGLADHLEEQIIKNLEIEIKDSRGDRPMMSMYMRDAAQYIDIIDYITEQDIETAKEMLIDMDTGARETFYEIFERETGINIYDIK